MTAQNRNVHAKLEHRILGAVFSTQNRHISAEGIVDEEGRAFDVVNIAEHDVVEPIPIDVRYPDEARILVILADAKIGSKDKFIGLILKSPVRRRDQELDRVSIIVARLQGDDRTEVGELIIYLLRKM